MTEGHVILLVAGAAAGGFINGLAGFGTALFALGFWLQFLEPLRAVSIVVVLSVVTGLQGIWVVRHAILEEPGRLLRFLIPGVAGVPIGIFSFAYLDAETLKLAIAGIMLLYGGFFLFRGRLPTVDRPAPMLDRAIGFAGGILGGAASLSGALPTMWCALRPWGKSSTRAVLQPYNVAILGLTMGIFAVYGVYDRQSLGLIAIALPVAVAASVAGVIVFGYLHDAQFRTLLVVMMFLSGALLAIRSLI
jgi:uncharacterized membrane protein YfcA